MKNKTDKSIYCHYYSTIKVLRSQLPRRNEYYEYDPPDETKESVNVFRLTPATLF